MISGVVLSTRCNLTPEKPNKIRGEWLLMANHRAGNVSFLALEFTSGTVFDPKVHPCGQLSLTCGSG